MKSIIVRDHELIERMDDKELEEFRAWLKRLVIKEPPKKKPSSIEQVRRWRDRHFPNRKRYGKIKLGIKHRCGAVLTDSNTYLRGGRLQCRTCDMLKTRKYMLKKMAQNLYRNLERDKLHSQPKSRSKYKGR